MGRTTVWSSGSGLTVDRHDGRLGKRTMVRLCFGEEIADDVLQEEVRQGLRNSHWVIV